METCIVEKAYDEALGQFKKHSYSPVNEADILSNKTFAIMQKP